MVTETRRPYRLWCCHRCELIGSQAEAKAHGIERGHEVDEIAEHLSDGIWDAWAVDAIAATRTRGDQNG